MGAIKDGMIDDLKHRGVDLNNKKEIQSYIDLVSSQINKDIKKMKLNEGKKSYWLHYERKSYREYLLNGLKEILNSH